jgi:hypothetical protein
MFVAKLLKYIYRILFVGHTYIFLALDYRAALLVTLYLVVIRFSIPKLVIIMQSLKSIG